MDHGLPPPGRAFEIASGDQRAVVTEQGATLRSYAVGGRPVVEPFGGPATPTVGCQGEILAPWPNRVVDGRWRWRGSEHQLAITEPSRGHALHGLVRTLAWRLVAAEADRVVLDTLLLGHPGWPFPAHLSASYALGPAGLAASVTATNVGREACPYGVAVHPYMAVVGGQVDRARLALGASTWLAADERLAPLDRRPVEGTPYEFALGEEIGARRVDHAFTDLARGPDGRVEAHLASPDGRTTTIWGGPMVRWWQVFTGDALPEPWRRTAITVEPMTCPPDALNSGEDLVVLEPGDAHTLTWGMSLA